MKKIPLENLKSDLHLKVNTEHCELFELKFCVWISLPVHPKIATTRIIKTNEVQFNFPKTNKHFQWRRLTTTHIICYFKCIHEPFATNWWETEYQPLKLHIKRNPCNGECPRKYVTTTATAGWLIVLVHSECKWVSLIPNRMRYVQEWKRRKKNWIKLNGQRNFFNLESIFINI